MDIEEVKEPYTKVSNVVSSSNEGVNHDMEDDGFAPVGKKKWKRNKIEHFTTPLATRAQTLLNFTNC